MNVVKQLLLGSGILLVSACSLLPGRDDPDGMFRDRDKDYLRAEPVKAMEVPESLASPPLEPLYPIPDVSVADDFGDSVDITDYAVPRPAAINADESNFGVKIQRLAGAQWVSIGASTSQVWPHVQSFLTVADVGVIVSNAESGLVETDWLQYSDDDSIMARFRISIEKGVHPDSTEIHVIEYQMPMAKEIAADIAWPEKSVSAEREEWMVRQIAEHLAESISNTSASLLGQNVGGEIKAFYVSGAAEPTLRLRLNRARAWATLLHAAKKEGFVTWDRSESKGIVFAGYDKDQEKKRGFWKRLFMLGYDGRLPEKVKHSLDDILTHLSGEQASRQKFDGIEGVAFGDALKKVEPGYLLVAEYHDSHADIIIRDHRGRLLPKEEAKRLIRIIRKNLI